MRTQVLILVTALALVAGANAAILNEVTYGDFGNSYPGTALGVYIGCSPFPPGCTDQINGQVSDPGDTSDFFSFWAGAIDGVTLSLTFTAQPSSGTVALYNNLSLTPLGSYSFNGNVTAGFDLLNAWGLGTSGDGVVDLPGGIYIIEVTGTSWGVPGSTNASYAVDITAAPEPGTYLLVGLGLAGFALVRRRRKA